MTPQDSQLPNDEKAAECLITFVGKLEVVAGYPKDDDPDGWDAELGQEAIRLRHDIRALLASRASLRAQLQEAERALTQIAAPMTGVDIVVANERKRIAAATLSKLRGK